MRFLIKTAFWLALIAFFLPSPQSGEGEGASVNYFGAFLGAQEALSDMSGFCERSPAACAAGRDVGTYVASRVGDGLVYAYSLARASGVEVAEPALAPAASTPTRDPMETAAVAAERVRQATGLAFRQDAPEAPPAPAHAQPAPASAVVPAVTIVPTPAPRA